MKYQVRFRLYQYNIKGLIANRYRNCYKRFDTYEQANAFRDKMIKWQKNNTREAEAVSFIMGYIHSGFIDAVYGVWEIGER